MLNGKFFTGLPPKMIDRGGTGGRNRMESHFFWPDDTKVDTAVESRIKRRNSVQLANTERPLYEKQTSVADIDVDTKKRFSKEFSQSSIQFYDNLNDNRSNSRRSMLRNSVGNKKMEIAEKPTKTKLELPESIVDEAYTTAKKKQAYTSKIEFYDYVNDREEPQNNRNNLRKPKMDMNDKREMELNSKNSPKLQVKRDVRSLSEEKEQRKINNREVNAVERSSNDYYNRRERDMILNNEERYLKSRRSVEPRTNVSPKRGLAKTTNNYLQRYSSERDIYREPSFERRKPSYYENTRETRDYRRDAATPERYENRRFSQRDEILEDNSYYRRERDEPIRINRNNNRQYYDPPEEKDVEYQHEEEIRSRMRNVHLKSPPIRKQYFPPEEYYDDEPQQHYYRHNDQNKTPTTRGSSHQRIDYNEREDNEVDLPYENYNSNKRLNNNNSSINKINNQIQQRPESAPTSPPPSDAESINATKSQKHLRSSLCFNNGEIIGANDATQSPTSTSQYPTQRRNARSSATQRVSVGLPD
ncbi:GATA zinc finger domain-containing protein 14 [Lucilia cuprina]|uniref:GATA zinc finger domain-containing protein 14 n=1 Tax=Lucilia cuprina TaxID=7375 RepID=UPI001F05664B|nr:GATA zinc finger domain-containing protein 14 [Lucilia cuprina]XP_046804175.1 GATA zinc finger domain-containing protein 14 [Lucilia cuprina]XP_046804176.1 GATA zinc finger domain-containing protein 14 [Lucilia cuprina]